MTLGMFLLNINQTYLMPMKMIPHMLLANPALFSLTLFQLRPFFFLGQLEPTVSFRFLQSTPDVVPDAFSPMLWGSLSHGICDINRRRLTRICLDENQGGRQGKCGTKRVNDKVRFLCFGGVIVLEYIFFF